MLLAAYLAQAAFFRTAGAYHAVRLAHTPAAGCWRRWRGISALLSAFLVNDTVCLMLTPLVLAVVEDARLPPVPYLLAVCMGSNSGSVATFTGNPQNMLIQGASGLSYASFAAYMALPAILVHRRRHRRRCCTSSASSCPPSASSPTRRRRRWTGRCWR